MLKVIKNKQLSKEQEKKKASWRNRAGLQDVSEYLLEAGDHSAHEFKVTLITSFSPVV